MMNSRKSRRPRPSPEYVAEQVLSELRINDKRDLSYLEEIARRRNALVVYETLNGSEARLAVVGARAIITVSDGVRNLYRRRFSIAHELGHLEMHRYETSLSICQSQDLNRWQVRQSNEDLEAEANRFAAAFLLPRPFFEPLCSDAVPSFDLIAKLAGIFQTSLTATALRYIHFSPEPCVVIYSEGGKVLWTIANPVFRELGIYIESRVRLDSASLAHRALQKNIPRLEGSVRLETWAAPGDYNRDANVREESWHFEGYDTVLTLLWANEEIYDDGELWEL